MRILKDWWLQILLALIIVAAAITLVIKIQYDTGKTIISQDVYTISTVRQHDNSNTVTVSLRNGHVYVLDQYKVSYKANSNNSQLIKYKNSIGSFELNDTYELVLNKM